MSKEILKENLKVIKEMVKKLELELEKTRFLRIKKLKFTDKSLLFNVKNKNIEHLTFSFSENFKIENWGPVVAQLRDLIKKVTKYSKRVTFYYTKEKWANLPKNKWVFTKKIAYRLFKYYETGINALPEGVYYRFDIYVVKDKK